MKAYLTAFLYLIIFFQLNAQSPERIFYSTMRPEGWDIYLAQQPGKNFKKFTEHPSLDYDAVIDPSGKHVIFTSERDGHPKLWIKAVDGSSPARLLISSNSMQNQATFSPDGKSIVFVSSHNGDADIYKLPFLPDSTIVVDSAINLTNNASGDFRPSFSPDGQFIAFSCDRAHPVKPHRQFSFAVHRTGDIYIMKSDGTDVKRLTDADAWDGSPVFSSNGDKLYFYSARSGELRLYQMNTDGSDAAIIDESGPKTISPTLWKNAIISSSWTNDNSIFNLSITDLDSGNTQPLYNEQIDMLNPQIHPSGLMVFHGGKRPKRNDNNRGGFDGELLVKNSPFSKNLDGLQVETYGVRRAFAAPPSPTSTTIIIDELEMNSPLDDINPLAFVSLLFLLPILLLVFAGIVLAVIHRKMIKFWRYLLLSMAALIILLLAVGSFIYFLVIEGEPLSTVRVNMLLIGGFFALLTWWAYKIWRKRRKAEKEHFRVSRMLTYALGFATAFSVYTALLNFWFFDVRPDFYEVNYVTNETKHLFTIGPELDVNPSNRQILDMKYNPDGSGFILSIGRFGSGPDQQGDIYEYNFTTNKAVRITESEKNDGFGGYSEDMQHFIYRSGESGTMDLYLKSGNETIQLTSTPAKENFPVISLKGDKIIFCTDASPEKRENNVRTMDIYLMTKTNSEWSQPERITDNITLEAHPHFSPEGEWIIYTTEEFGIMDEQPIVQTYMFGPQMYGEIVAQRLSDGKKVRITHNKWEEGAPLWEKGVPEALSKMN